MDKINQFLATPTTPKRREPPKVYSISIILFSQKRNDPYLEGIATACDGIVTTLLRNKINELTASKKVHNFPGKDVPILK